MALKVKDAAASAQKFIQRGQAAGPDYQKGVTGSGSAWAAATAASVDTYNAGVQEAIARGAFAKGVQAAGPSRYEERAAGVGAQRYPQGVASSGDRYAQAVSPYLQTLASLTLIPRRPKGDPSNYQRAQQVGEALRRRKVGQ